MECAGRAAGSHLMSRDLSLRWAAGVGALAALATGGLLAFRDGSLLTGLATLPLAIGLGACALRKTWGVFATLGGAALVLVAFGVGRVPAWAAMIAVAGLAVTAPLLLRAFRFDAPAAAAWLALAGLSGGGAALAWDELEPMTHAPCRAQAPMTPIAPPAPEAAPVWNVRVEWMDHRKPCARDWRWRADRWRW